MNTIQPALTYIQSTTDEYVMIILITQINENQLFEKKYWEVLHLYFAIQLSENMTTTL